MNLEIGMLAKVKAGHDKDCIYVITNVDNTNVYLADGNIRPVCKPKKKNKKHVQPICYKRCDDTKNDMAIADVIKEIVRDL